MWTDERKSVCKMEKKLRYLTDLDKYYQGYTSNN